MTDVERLANTPRHKVLSNSAKRAWGVFDAERYDGAPPVYATNDRARADARCAEMNAPDRAAAASAWKGPLPKGLEPWRHIIQEFHDFGGRARSVDDEPRYMVTLVPGWQGEGAHAVYERTIAECIGELRRVERCKCAECEDERAALVKGAA